MEIIESKKKRGGEGKEEECSYVSSSSTDYDYIIEIGCNLVDQGDTPGTYKIIMALYEDLVRRWIREYRFLFVRSKISDIPAAIFSVELDRILPD